MFHVDKGSINNYLLHSPLDFGKDTYLKLNDVVYLSKINNNIKKGNIGINQYVRIKYSLALGDTVKVIEYSPPNKQIDTLDIIISSNTNKMVSLHEDEIKDMILEKFKGHYFYPGQWLNVQNLGEHKLLLIYVNNQGYINNNTTIKFRSNDVNLTIVGSKVLSRDLFKENYRFEDIGIGGLDANLIRIFREALCTRAIKKEIIEKMGIKHTKGILLYGPPGTGKTLIARKIGSMISPIKPKVVNGPSILDKYVGGSEKNIRDLFSEAISDPNNIHVIIFDEIDAICRSRGSSTISNNTSESVVAQLLSMIDGVNAIDNIFIIAMTNRKDLLDPALLRSGRIEIHIEILPPDFKGRQEIFRIHTNKMSFNNMLGQDVDYGVLANMTENFSGAEIQNVVNKASSLALYDNIDSDDIKVEMNYFREAINMINPIFGKKMLTSIDKFTKHDHINLMNECFNYIASKKNAKSILVYGGSGHGKTTFLVKLGNDINLNNLGMVQFIKMINSFDVINKDESEKAKILTELYNNGQIFDSLLLIDDMEIMINFSDLGGINFSNKLYQIIITMIKKIEKNVTIVFSVGNEILYNYMSKYFDYSIKLN